MHNSARNIEATQEWSDVLYEFEFFEEAMYLAKEAVKKPAQTIEGIVTSGDSFMATNVNYFFNPDQQSDGTSSCFSYLSQIRRTFNEFRRLRESFGGLQSQCEAMIKDCHAAKKEVMPPFRRR